MRYSCTVLFRRQVLDLLVKQAEGEDHLEEYVEQVGVRLVQLEHLAAAPREVHHGLQCGAPLQGLVGPVQLRVRLLEQRAPELVARVRLNEDEFSVPGGEVVVHHHIHPLTVLPKPAPQYFNYFWYIYLFYMNCLFCLFCLFEMSCDCL